MDISQKEIYSNKLGDERLDKRANKLSAMLYFGRTSSIHEMSSDEAEQKAAYRFLANEKVEETKLIATAIERSSYLSADKDVLVLQDTSEINLDNHRNRLKRGSGVGLTGNDKDLGFFLHGSLVLDCATEIILGYSNIQLWHREEDKTDKERRNYKYQPIEEKESYKWIKACNESKNHLSQAHTITFIEDREGDIYHQFATVPDSRTHLIIRSRDNRRLSDGSKLFDKLSEQPVAGQYEIPIVKDIRKGVESRTAVVEVRYCKVSIARPVALKKKELPESVKLYAIEVKEINPPQGVSKVCWRLLTTHFVRTFEEAVNLVKKYRLRWYIEQLFRLLKKKGFKIESSELETGWAIRKLTVMILSSALRVMQLLLAYNKEDSQPIEQVFNQKEINCLKAINETLHGETEKSKNKNNPTNLSWATWIIARLGGWKNYNSKRPPGPIILKKGLDRFANIYQGWSLAQNE
jgi:hypothetical protein